jgi:hypothetical protein
MKIFTGSLVLMCAMTLLCSPAAGQVIITATDVSNALVVGHALADSIDTVATTINIGQPGLTSWDFSGLRHDSAQTFTSVTPSGTPYTGQFPTATHTFQTDLKVVYMGSVISATGYIYFELGTNFLNLGQRADAPTFFNGKLVSDNTPADLYYGLPSTYLSSWTSTYFDTTSIFLFGTVFASGTGARHNATYVVDAYGRMTMPGGSVHDALRIKKTDSVATYSGGTLTISKYVNYIFLGRDLASVQVTAADLLQPDNGTIQIVRKSASWNMNLTNIPLPIQLAAFNALQNPSGGGIVLHWSTLSEVNNYGFEIQRGTTPGGSFTSIAGVFIPGHGTTTAPQEYSYTDPGAPAGTWYYRLKQMDLDGAIHFSDLAKVDVRAGQTAGDVPSVFSLAQNYPNPFNPTTVIRYSIPAKAEVTLALYNTLGERVAVLVSGEQERGSHDVRFDGSSLASGVYFYRLQSAGLVETKKLSLVR